MKSLGQVAWEAAQITATQNWCDVDEWTQAQFNTIAEAVRRAALEQHAQAVESAACVRAAK